MTRSVRYAQLGDCDICFEVTGAGNIDLLHIPGLLNHIESTRNEPAVARHYGRLAEFSRVIRFDKRGTGLSGPLPAGRMLTLEDRVDEAVAVLEAARVSQAAVYATADGVPVALFLAATHPDRVSALVLYAASARYYRAPDYADGFDPRLNEVLEAEFQHWGDDDNPAGAALTIPRHATDPAVRRSVAQMQRLAGSPRTALSYWRLACQTDVRHVLSAVQAPALVMHSATDALYPVPQGRWLARHLPRSTYVELPEGDHFFYWGPSSDQVARAIEEFLTGTTRDMGSNRALATVLFPDLVDSTRRVLHMGDRSWRELLDKHDQIVRAQLARFGGREVKTTGDGFLAIFDGPSRAVRCAITIRDEAVMLGLAVRAGLHTGEVEVRDSDIAGIAVHIAARILSQAGPNEVVVSRTVSDLMIGSGIKLADHGVRRLRGVDGEWQLFLVTP